VVTIAVAEPSPKANRQKRRCGASKPANGLIGREPKLTDAKVEAIATKIAEGRSMEVACALNGVSRRAATYWLAMANALVGQVSGKPKDRVTGEESEAESPWPRLPAPLLVRFLHAVTHARAQAEDFRIKRIEKLSDGGTVIYQRTETTENPKTGLKRTVTEKRRAPGDWRGHAYLQDRMDRLNALRDSATPTEARPPDGKGGAEMDFLEIVRRAYELAHAPNADPRALLAAPPPGQVVEGQAVKVS
jgi:hypothetical protein